MTKSEYVKWRLEQQELSGPAQMITSPSTYAEMQRAYVYDGSGMRAWIPPETEERQFYGVPGGSPRYVFTEPDSHGSAVKALAWAFLIVTVLAVGCVALVGL